MNQESLDNIEYAYMESNGEISFVKKADISPITPDKVNKHVNAEVSN